MKTHTVTTLENYIMTAHSNYESEERQSPTTSAIASQLSSWLTTVCNTVFDWLFVEYPEPQIIERRGCKGRLYWEIYDPTTGKFMYCGTDDEVRTWLDIRHYGR